MEAGAGSGERGAGSREQCPGTAATPRERGAGSPAHPLRSAEGGGRSAARAGPARGGAGSREQGAGSGGRVGRGMGPPGVVDGMGRRGACPGRG
ncbi:hypothetical protein Tbon_07220 [Tepidiforma bonchosmolovskayae]|uniref:Uncharacterized protein n=1 Tax=Tepidiforma bonchosmolovskayae TaxID=2601677 RepID=A0ABX6C1D4_9CHLR|nr:hypothetical protein Tbon_07220 [Tepidiforma bonchosmolovskayae]